MFLGVAVTIPLFFVYSGPPPAWNVFTRDVLTLVVAASLLVFMACFAHLVRRADEGCGWLASIIYGATIVFVSIVLVSTALEAGVVFGADGVAVDPTIQGPLADANILFVPSLYFGTDVKKFCSAIGWGNSAFVASFLAYWVLAVSISVLFNWRNGRDNVHTKIG